MQPGTRAIRAGGRTAAGFDFEHCAAAVRGSAGGRGPGESGEGRLLRRDARAHVLFARCIHRRRADHAGRGLQVRAGQGRRRQRPEAQHRPAARLGGRLRPRRIHRRDVLDAGAGCQGWRQPDARGVAQSQERRRAAGLVPEVCRREQPRREPRSPAVLRRSRDDTQRLEGCPDQGRDRQLPARQVHDAGGLRVDRRAEGREHASQRHFP